MVPVRTESVLGDERIPVFILPRVDAGGGNSVGHGLILVLAEVELVFGFVVVYAAHDLGPDEGASSNNALNGDHLVEMLGGERAGIT